MRIADDFGLGRGHDRIILSLLESGRLDGTSVIIGDAMEPEDIYRLRELRVGGVKVGLHLNLTETVPGGGPVWRLSQLLKPISGTQFLDQIKASLIWQIDVFVTLFGSLPDYYDGHQHCHCFPAITPLVTRLPYRDNAWVRVPLPATWAGRWLNFRAGGAKVLIIMALAARARTIFVKAELQINRDFSGFLRLDEPSSVRRWLPRLLSEMAPECLMMLHPGDDADPMQCAGHGPASRAIEAQILSESLTK
ncbi:ChbG/HpnK family deacetylase [Ochrobactrum chromiisoli]|uniref:ChbG/HpnK family deacetylase n=1 Tax=Ochrobactrum chromiisoli TaxID=2993941 RepID=A0ABT3QSR2_9HYPH|nr:ChbG/HpnK family deacetylase [Ochrobactrum chromiisoli]MCX2698663.1 ChbG/HpnK family deacetylase [Ochrobactrum chromiisoli]